MIVVTAASSNHAGALGYLLGSLRALDAPVECYDLGLTADDVRGLPQHDVLRSAEHGPAGRARIGVPMKRIGLVLALALAGVAE